MTPQQRLAYLRQHGLSLSIEKAGKIVFESKDAMLKPLFTCLVRHREELRGATVTDKVVGRAAALLAVLGEVSAVITPTASESAKAVLDAAGIPLFAEQMIPQIANRDGTDICPMEKMANECAAAQEFYNRLCGIIKLD